MSSVPVANALQKIASPIIRSSPSGCAKEHDSEDANSYQSSGVLVAFVLAYHEAWSGSTLNFSLWGGWQGYGVEITEPSPAIGCKMRVEKLVVRADLSASGERTAGFLFA